MFKESGELSLIHIYPIHEVVMMIMINVQLTVLKYVAAVGIFRNECYVKLQLIVKDSVHVYFMLMSLQRQYLGG